MKYQVTLRGENFRIEIEGRVARHGFYTTRFVEADSPEAAEHLAVDIVRRDASLQAIVRNAPTDPPMIYLERMTELATFGGRGVPGSGYTWFLDAG